MQDSSPLQALSDILLGSGASGSSSLLAHSADELYFGESLILGSSADVVLPASLPVYRNSLLDAADNTDAMKARLRTVLDALGLDTTLADTAAFSRDSADTISKTVSGIKESAEQNGWDADSSVLNYLSGAAQLQLNIPESDWPGGLTITVSNDLRTSVVCNSSAEVKTFATLAEERVIAADLQEKYGSLFTSLLGGEYTDVTDGGDSTIYGQPSSLFVKFAADSFHYLLVSVDTDGNLLSLHETDRTVEPLGEYTSVSRAEADKRLANGEFLTDSYTAETVDPTAEPEDLANLRIAASCGVTGVMLPFVRGKQDILALRQALAEAGAPQIRIFAKIENLAGVQALPEFLSLVDEVVIARGDLGNAMPLWELPRCQKQLSAACRAAGVPFMVVTQMLDSMHTRAVPTRAEVSDIYNAVLDGASSLMLTGETAAGQYPVQAMEYLVRTARTAM